MKDPIIAVEANFWDHFATAKTLEIPDSKAFRCELDKIDEVFAISPQSHPKILDVGCGVGKYAIHFLKKGFSVTGVDISKESLSLIEKRAKYYGVKKNLELVEFDFYSPRFEDEFDACDMISMLECIPVHFRKALFANVVKAIRPGGKVFVFEANIKNPFMFIGQVFFGVQPFRGTLNLFSLQKSNILNLMKTNTLSGIHITPYGFFPTRFINSWPLIKRINEIICSIPILNQFCLFYLYTGIKSQK